MRQKFFLGQIIAITLLAAATAGAGEWRTDYEQALATAKASNKYVLLEFTGSDWCPPCIQMRKAIFSQPAFLNYAQKNLVLVEVDFPRRKKQQEETVKQNARLKQQYDIERSGFPTIVLLNPAGKPIARLEGYGGERASDMIAWIEEQRGKQ